MALLSAWFKKLLSPSRPVELMPPREKPGAASPDKPAPDRLTQIRHQAATGDPKLKGKHRSGSF